MRSYAGHRCLIVVDGGRCHNDVGKLDGASHKLTSILWPVRLSWLENACSRLFRWAILTGKVGQKGLVFGVRSIRVD